jgi:1,2-diacylglycerol 3-alpha-glucosyltransferase
MRVGILTNTYPPNLNGVSVAVSSLEKNLINLGVEVFIATPQVKDVVYPKHVLPLRSATVPDSISPDLKVPYLYLNDVKHFFEENKVDIIHTHDTILGGAEGALLGYQLKLPTVHTFHTLIEEYNYFQIPGYKPLISNFVKEVCNQYDHVIAPSQKVYRYLLEKGVAVPISQILNIPNYTDLTDKISEKEKKGLLNKFQIQKTDTVLITFCRLAEEKGLEMGINLLEPILKKNSNLKYILAGWGPFGEKLQEIVAQKNLSNQILFYGKYTRKELPLLASVSNLFIFTSLTENLPTNIWEAMYLGLPVISLDDSSVDYLLIDGVNGVKTSLEKFTQKCSDLVSDPILLQKMSILAKESAEKINPTEIASLHLDLYTKIVEITKQNKLDKEKTKFKVYFNEFLKNSLKSSQELYEKLLENLN